jgi:hypothetical protein
MEMTDRETMKQVLNALNEIRDITQHYKAYDTIAIDAITALEARLAEPEQEPVAKVIPGTRKASEPPKQEPVHGWRFTFTLGVPGVMRCVLCEKNHG